MKINFTDTFSKWLNSLKNKAAYNVIINRLKRIEETGNFGDCKSVGNGIFEIRIKYGCGYRIYYTFENNELVILLCGGDKSTQQDDITKAKKMIKIGKKNDR